LRKKTVEQNSKKKGTYKTKMQTVEQATREGHPEKKKLTKRARRGKRGERTEKKKNKKGGEPRRNEAPGARRLVDRKIDVEDSGGKHSKRVHRQEAERHVTDYAKRSSLSHGLRRVGRNDRISMRFRGCTSVWVAETDSEKFKGTRNESGVVKVGESEMAREGPVIRQPGKDNRARQNSNPQTGSGRRT